MNPTRTPERLPVAFLPHGGGPWPFVEMGLPETEVRTLSDYLRSVADLPPTPPRALLVVSAHWEEALPTVQTGEHPPLLFDYYGFPEASYHLTWPAPGNPALAARVRELLTEGGFQTAEDRQRGFDHGTFIPLKVTYPGAQISTVQLSLKAGLDPAEHLALGRALAPLRDEGVFILGSGMTFHNLRAFGNPKALPEGKAFDAWLQKATLLEAPEREEALLHWKSAPSAAFVHPREEHLIPLMVIVGAAGADPGTLAFQGTFGGLPIAAFHFGV